MQQVHWEQVRLADAFDQQGTQDAVVSPRQREMVEDAQKMESPEKGTGLQQKETVLQEKELLVVQ